MATATQVQLDDTPVLAIAAQEPSPDDTSPGFAQDEALHLARLTRQALHDLDLNLPDFSPSTAYTAVEILALPLDRHRVPDQLHDLPRRRSARAGLALLIAPLLYPVHEGSLTAIIRYDADRVRVRGWAALQRRYDLLLATKRNGRTVGGVGGGRQAPVWSTRITNQGPWDPVKTAVSLAGVRAVPMPVKVAQEAHLAPFLAHLRNQGTHQLTGREGGVALEGGRGEPYYRVQGAEFRKGVVYEDGRMDLCKMVVGPDHIWRLMGSLRNNTFVRHFLLGNNIIGPCGAQAIASFINEFPERMETWYLAGNCIDGPSFKLMVNAMVTSPVISNVWLKRNPLGPDAAEDVFRLVTQAENLRTLDLDQTELGDSGTADLFTRLAAYAAPEGRKLPLRNVYLNGNGISSAGAAAIASFLAAPHCAVSSVYLSCNPLGDGGAAALASALPAAPHLTRLFLQSAGVSTRGAVALCAAVEDGMRALDLGQAYATEDLGQAYNYIEDGAVPAIKEMLRGSKLEYFNLGHCPITHPGILDLDTTVLDSPSLLYYSSASILRRPSALPAFIPSRPDLPFPDANAPSVSQMESEKRVRAHLEANVRARFGADVDYTAFLHEEKRWLVSDRDVRKIDSVYRNRDAGMARRGLLTLVKGWEEGDDTLGRVRNAEGPVCVLRKG
ncbi:Protein NLRC3 [Tolypocladium capitatum]|uniref:Protein NLRC3 n=1 Tax=Tolypocladium capitatum TaxID=45235 RepID=A0A2K3PSN8_9HYPO|nr:Protein NLRC3 [Tolypocladium capitatum]